MRDSPPPWLWTLAVAGMLAAVVAGGGVVLSRRVESFPEKPPGNRVEDAFRQAVRRIAVLEGLWQEALQGEASRMLEPLKHGDALPVAGVVQSSWLNPAFSDPARAHRRADGGEVRIRPVLERFARGNAGEWSFSESGVMDGAGWIEQANRPLAWHQGNGRVAVVLLLDTRAAANAAEGDLAKRKDLELPEDEPGALSWHGPGGRVLASHGVVPEGGKPDEILRHVSRFGDWTLRRTYPVRVVTSYRTPVLAGSFSIAALLLAGGVSVASWQRKSIRLAEERVSFVNRVSHELRTPLTNLLLNTDLALDDIGPAEGRVRRWLGLIREETSRLSRIVDNVLAFARMERGQRDDRIAACDVGKILGELRGNFSPMFGRKSIVCRFDNQLTAMVPVDGDALSQILSNLLSNIEKYAGEGANAVLQVALDEDRLVIAVEDDGPGISSKAHHRVFLPFERAGSRVDEGASGTGLGLAISRELAERMGGRLDLVPIAKGAKFRLTIPLDEGRGT